MTWQETLSGDPLPVHYSLETIPSLLTPDYFPSIADITKKQSALQAALDLYCSQLSTNSTFVGVECEGYPPDPSIPGRSILQGFYGDNIDHEPVNPYTGGYSCNDGFKPIAYNEYWDQTTSEHFTGYYCLNSSMPEDELHYFGGFYEMCGDDDMNDPHCNMGNELEASGQCACPKGFTPNLVSQGWTNHFDADCWHSSDWTAAFTFMCYNASVPLTETVIAGMYTTNNQTGIPNVYTKTFSCHTGFTAHPVGHECDDSTDGHCHQTAITYVCLNNIYPV